MSPTPAITPKTSGIVTIWKYLRWSHDYRQYLEQRMICLNDDYHTMLSECRELSDDLARRRLTT